ARATNSSARSSLNESADRKALARRLPARQHEAIAVRIAELGERAGGLRPGLVVEFDAALAHLAIGVFDVVAGDRAVEEGADARLVAIGGEEHDARLGPRYAEFDPALAGAHGLVGQHLEADLLGPEADRGVLVARGD